MSTSPPLKSQSPTSKSTAARILVVDDDAAMGEMLLAGLSNGYEVHSVTRAEDVLPRLESSSFDCVITDVKMGRANGIDLCRELSKTHPELPVIVVTAFGSIQTAIEAVRAGAFEFLTKPFELDALRHVVGRAVQHFKLTRKVEDLEQSLKRLQTPHNILGSSESIAQLKRLIGRVAPSDVTVLITGESGTGKELVARQLHEQSPRENHPFVALNCAALPEALLESELFGHVRGAFTDARSDKVGLFTQAGEGTLFLDEIGELPLNLQPKLLRVLQERVLRPLGGNKDMPFGARVIAATNRDLEQEVKLGRFREDLFYRIQVVQLVVPPLRVRGNDVLLIAQTFARRFSDHQGRSTPRFSREFSAALQAYSWPGNVRELSNCMERAIALGDPEELTPEDLPERIAQGPARPPAANGNAEFVTLEEIERRHILNVFEAVKGNKSLSARILGLNRKTLYRKLKEYGVLDEDSEP